MTVSFLACALLVQAEPKVSIDLPISPLTVIAREVSAQTKEPYKVTGFDPERRLFVQVKAMPASRLRQALATATGGKWTKVGSTWHLHLLPSEDLEQQAFTQGIEKWIAEQVAEPTMDQAGMDALIRRGLELSEQGSSREAAYELQILRDRTPKSRILTSCLLSLPKGELASVRRGERRVYALNPTKLQRPLPGSFPSAFAKFIEEDELMHSRVEALVPRAGERGSRGASFLFEYSDKISLREAAYPLLILQRSEMSDEQISVDMVVHDKSGRRLRNWMTWVAPSGLFDPPPGKPTTGNPFEALTDPVEFVGEEKDFAEDMANFGRLYPKIKGKLPLSPVARKRLLGMDKVDPLTFGATDVFRQLAKTLQKQIVAHISDQALFFQAQRRTEGSALTLSDAVTRCLQRPQNGHFEVEASDDLLVVKPQLPAMSEPAITLDRKLCAAYLRATDSGGDTLEPLADLCAWAGATRELSIPFRLAILFGGPLGMAWNDENAFQTLSLYGKLNGAQKKAASSGGFEAPLAVLPKEVVDRAEQLLLSVQGIKRRTPEMLADIRSGKVTERAVDDKLSMMRFSASSLEEEPTVFLAQCSIQEIQLKFTVERSQQIFRHYNDPMEMMGVAQVTAEMAAREILSMGKRPGESTPVFLTGGLRMLKATFRLPHEGRVTKTFSLKELDTSLPSRPYTELPDPFRTQIEQALKKLRESQSGRPSGAGTQ